jgi:hypothetical protein
MRVSHTQPSSRRFHWCVETYTLCDGAERVGKRATLCRQRQDVPLIRRDAAIQRAGRIFAFADDRFATGILLKTAFASCCAPITPSRFF